MSPVLGFEPVTLRSESKRLIHITKEVNPFSRSTRYGYGLPYYILPGTRRHVSLPQSSELVIYMRAFNLDMPSPTLGANLSVSTSNPCYLPWQTV